MDYNFTLKGGENMRNNDEIVAYVDSLRKAQKMSLNELARETGLAKSSISRYFNKTRAFPVNKVHLFAKTLHTSSEDILGFKNTNTVTYPTAGDDSSVSDDISSYGVRPKNMVETTTKYIPLIGEIVCGDPITAEENIEEYITHVFPKGQVPFGELIDLRAKGHSMEPTIPNGSIVTIRLQPEVEDGEIAAVQVNGDTEATLKRVKHIDGLVMLKPDNDAYDPIIITSNTPATIVGKAIQFTSKL